MSAVCIIGMHRSGTSVITGLLRAHGLRIGSEDCLLGPHESNPTGHFEHKGFLEINEVLLARLGGAWDKPVEFPRDWRGDGRFDDLAERAASLVESLACSHPWGWKEPRTTLLLPFWQAVVPGLRYVICIRHPLEVAHSLEARDGFALARAIDLWLHYTRAALAFTRGRPRIFTFYRDYFANPLAEIRRIAHFCGLGPPDDPLALSRLLSARLCHHRSGARRLLVDPVIPVSAKLLYYRLRAARYLSVQAAARG
jgi:O-antigen biosynthesis protein